MDLREGTSAPALAIEHLSLGYVTDERLRRAVWDVSLTVPAGGAYGLVGESGCGKTTIANAVMRYLPSNAVVEAGRVVVAGRDVFQLSEHDLRLLRGKHVAMVYQDPVSALNPSMRVGDQIAEVFRLRDGAGREGAQRATVEILEKVRLSDAERKYRRYPYELSGGEAQRVVIAMALAGNPRLLVLDEPTTGLDVTVEAEVLDVIRNLREEFGTAILYISHDLGVVAEVCDQVGVLYSGRLVEEGRVDELFAAPAHPYTAALLAAMPKVSDSSRDRLKAIPGSLPPLGANAPGCIFVDRCVLARPRCIAEDPVAREFSATHRARCWFSEEIGQAADDPPADVMSRELVRDQDVLLKVDALSVIYRIGGESLRAVDEISFEVRRGEVFALVGESGSGKSSVAQCVAGLLEPTAGSILLDGRRLLRRDLRRRLSLRRRIQMVFQRPERALNPAHTAGFVLSRAVKKLAAGTGGEHDVAVLASRVKLEPPMLGLKPGALSGGLKQRVGIAAAIAGRPSLVVCDEPTSALDVSVQASVLNLLAELRATEGLAYILITHDLAVVRFLADTIGVMYLGQLVEIGAMGEVFAPPHHPYTEALLAAVPRFVEGHGTRRTRLGGDIPSMLTPPTGCRFHTRCPRYLGDQCRTVVPPWQRRADGHQYRCHIEPTRLERLQRGDEEEEAR